MRSDDKPGKPRPSATEILAVILDHVADEVAGDIHSEPTEADRRWAREERAKMQARIAEMKRRRMPSHAVLEFAAPIPREIRALGREELLARLEEEGHRRAAQYAHRDLTGLTDDDLRQMLAILVRRR